MGVITQKKYSSYFSANFIYNYSTLLGKSIRREEDSTIFMSEESIIDAKKKNTSEKLSQVACKDGSYTYYNHEVGQAYHSPMGAALEAKEKYVVPCNFAQRSRNKEITLFDVCFGFGYNSAAALEEIWKHNPQCKVNIIGLELDKAILGESLELPFPFAHKELFEELAQTFVETKQTFVLEKKNISITLLIGDAKERVKEVKEKADIVFFDPFSPSKSPELWTKEFMTDVYACCADKALLVTYSCARAVRENLAGAGFIVSDGPIVGRRGPATIGIVKRAQDS